MSERKFGVKLITYGNQVFNSWVYDGPGDGPFSTTDLEAAEEIQEIYSTKNPKGLYVVQEIGVDEC